jgi:phosphatidylglycerophosphatase A
MINFLARACASLGGVGFFPFMPGTAGSLVTVVVAWFLSNGAWLPLLVAAMIVSVVGLVVAQYATNGQGDPSWIVIDEAAGMLLALLGAPHTSMAFFAAFLFFRVLDIYKPLGINSFQRLPGAWGVMLDDIAAGLITAIFLQAALYVMPF